MTVTTTTQSERLIDLAGLTDLTPLSGPTVPSVNRPQLRASRENRPSLRSTVTSSRCPSTSQAGTPGSRSTGATLPHRARSRS